jgi:hypothetical protein
MYFGPHFKSKISIIALTLGCLAYPLPSFALVDFLRPSVLTEKVQREFARQKVKLEFKLFDLNVMEGVTTSANYRYAVEPYYIDNYYTRYDVYNIGTNVNPAAWVESLRGPFSLGLSQGTDLIFARQFKSHKEAYTALPYLPNRIPISAERALNQLSTGDFVSFQTHLTLLASIGGSFPLSGPIVLNGATHALMSGHFLVHLYKVDADRVRLKLIALHDDGVGGAINIGVNRQFYIFAFKVGPLNIERAWTLNLGTAYKNLDFTDIYMIDFVLNLRDPEVAAAYDAIMQKKVMFKSTQAFIPAGEIHHMEKELITDFTDLQKLYERDKDKPQASRKVDRIFKGTVKTTALRTGFNFNVTMMRFNSDTLFARNRIANFNSSEKPEYYLFDTFSNYKRRSLIFRILDHIESFNTNLLFSSNTQFEPQQLVGFFLNREVRAKRMNQDEFEELKAHLKVTLPESIFSQIPLNSWDLSKGAAQRAFFHHEIFFATDSVGALLNLDPAELKKRYQDFLRTLPKVHAYPMRVDPLIPNQEGNIYGTEPSLHLPVPERYEADLDFISKKMSIAFDPKQTNQNRYDAFLGLKDNELFQETGAGFLIRLLPSDRLGDLLGYSLSMSGRKQESINYHFGKPTGNPLYYSMLYIQNLLNSQIVDLNLLRESSTVPVIDAVPSPSPSP